MDRQAVITETAKAAPPASVAAVHYFYSVTLPEFINVATAIYIVGLLVQMGWRFSRWYAARQAARKAAS